MTLQAGMNLREALLVARRLGCAVGPVSGTGEILVTHPAWPRRIRVNGRRRSAPRALVGPLLGLERAALGRPGDP